jgi:rhodanese-related sulfurtransferase
VTKPATLEPVAPREAQALVAAGKAVLVDIREPLEHARERIPGARLVPLSKLDPGMVAAAAGGRKPIFHCLSGNRTNVNAACLAGAAPGPAYVVAGGLNAWKAAGLPTALDRKAPLDLMRQVQIATGSLVLAGAVLAASVSPWFILLAGLVGAGLAFAGATGFCGMARLLARMPWNRVRAAA